MMPVTTFGENQRRRHLIRVIVASTVGTSIEWYDFFLYGVAAALVFPQRFFPRSDPYTGTLLAFSTYFVGFAARPARRLASWDRFMVPLPFARAAAVFGKPFAVARDAERETARADLERALCEVTETADRLVSA